MPTENVVIVDDTHELDKKEELGILYEKIRILDKQMKLFKDRINKIKYIQPDDPNINSLQRDIWDMEQKRVRLYNIFRGYKDEEVINRNTIVLPISDIMEYAAWLAGQDLKKNKYKLLQLLSKIHCKGVDRYHDWLDELKEDLLKRCMECE